MMTDLRSGWCFITTLKLLPDNNIGTTSGTGYNQTVLVRPVFWRPRLPDIHANIQNCTH